MNNLKYEKFGFQLLGPISTGFTPIEGYCNFSYKGMCVTLKNDSVGNPQISNVAVYADNGDGVLISQHTSVSDAITYIDKLNRYTDSGLVNVNGNVIEVIFYHIDHKTIHCKDINNNEFIAPASSLTIS